MDSLEERRIFLISTSHPERCKLFTETIQKHISQATIFSADDGPETIFKVENYPPHVLIIDRDLPKQSGIEVIETLQKNPKYNQTAIIIISEIPDREHFVDDVVTGRVQFLENPESERPFNNCISRALNFVAQDNRQEYKLHFLTGNEVLFNKGEKATSVYIVKKGELEAFVPGTPIKVLGKIQPGEFVGEMSHFNGEPRSASVRSLTDCELIEIPSGILDMVLFTKPAWSKALMQTLSRRLKRTNEVIAKS